MLWGSALYVVAMVTMAFAGGVPDVRGLGFPDGRRYCLHRLLARHDRHSAGMSRRRAAASSWALLPRFLQWELW